MEPLVDGRAQRVWATVLLGSNGPGTPGTKGELKNAQLRGGVMVHQDPAPNEAFGCDASGEALDLTNQGNGLMKFAVKSDEPPQAAESRTKLVSDIRPRRSWPATLARVEYKGKTIEAEDIIGVDQTANFAWAQGAGIFTQMADRGLLNDKGIESKSSRGKAPAAGPVPQDKLVITWTEEMRFYGISVDLENRPAAKIEFRGTSKEVRTVDGRKEYRRGVVAKLTDSGIFSDTMDVYTDRPIAFDRDSKRATRSADDPEAGPEPEPQISMLDCKGKDVFDNGKLRHPGVDVITQKRYPDSEEVSEKQRIQGQHIIYDKATGNFFGQGAGMAYLYRRGADGKRSPLIPTVVPVPGTDRTEPEVVASEKKLPALELTQIRFNDGMRGRFGVGKDKVEQETREAEFFGAVQAANAQVESPISGLSFDTIDRRPDYVFLTSDVLTIFSEPMPKGSKTADKQLLNARGNATARARHDLISADRITYNSATALTYAYGDGDKNVAFTQQAGNGQAPNTVRGESFRYNNKTGESNFKDPYAIQFTDLTSGIRAKPFFPDLGGTPKAPDPLKTPRMQFMRQGRSATERKAFSGN